MSRSLVTLTLLVAAMALAAPPLGSSTGPDVRLPDLTGTLVDPFDVPRSTKAVVVVFVSVDCPVSNRYAPEVRRLHDRYVSQGVAFWIVYPNPAEPPETIRRHLREYSYPTRALRDPTHALVRAAGVSVTPEAAVYDRDGRLVYRGRIDDRYVNIALERPRPTTHDLDDVLAAIGAGRRVTPTMTQAVGCYVADFLP